MDISNFTFKIIETEEEAKSAFFLYADVHLNDNPYYLELLKNSDYKFDKEIFYNYHVHSRGKVIRDKLSCIAVDNSNNKVVAFICAEDLFTETNPDLPEQKPLFILLGKDIYKKSLERFIREGKIEISKNFYLGLSKVTTHYDYYRIGLSYNLFKYVENVAKQRGFKYLYIDPAHENVQKLVLCKLKFEEIGRLDYNDIEFEGKFTYLGLFQGFEPKPQMIYCIKKIE